MFMLPFYKFFIQDEVSRTHGRSCVTETVAPKPFEHVTMAAAMAQDSQERGGRSNFYRCELQITANGRADPRGHASLGSQA
jgi:hypothetical protein